MKVNVHQHQKDLRLPSTKVKALTKAVLGFEGVLCDEVDVHLIDNAEMCRLHELYFDDPSPTDCISFPLDDTPCEGYRVLGEIFVCPAAAIEYVKTHKGTPLQETVLYIVHGLLHLVGYDDIKIKDRKKMRAAEKRHMQYLESQGLL